MPTCREAHGEGPRAPPHPPAFTSAAGGAQKHGNLLGSAQAGVALYSPAWAGVQLEGSMLPRPTFVVAPLFLYGPLGLHLDKSLLFSLPV